MRRALLLAIDSYQDEAEPSLRLDAPRNDVEILKEALVAVGVPSVNIEIVVSSQKPGLSTTGLRRNIDQFFRSGRAGQHLILYFSGHGADLDNARVLIPEDYDREYPIPADELVDDHWIYNSARASAADSILTIIDACREGLELRLQLKDTAKNVAPPKEDAGLDPKAPTIAILYSCEASAQSFASKGEDAKSYFAAALAHVLRTDETAATLADVIRATTEQLARTQSRHQRQTPFLDERLSIEGRAGKPLDLIIKEDEASRLRIGIGRSRWCRRLDESRYWQVLNEQSAGLALQVKVIAFRTEELVRQADAGLPDHWRSDDALDRFLEGLEKLIPPDRLPAKSLTACIAAIFGYEAALAGMILRLKSAKMLVEAPCAIETTTPHRLPARAWAQYLRHEDDLARRRQHLIAAGQPERARELLAWQLVNFTHRAGEVWTYSPGVTAGARGWFNDVYDDVFSIAPFDEVGGAADLADALSGRRVLRFARMLFADPEDLENEVVPGVGRLGAAESPLLASPVWTQQEIETAEIVSLAGALALDARRLPPVLAEHLGIEADLSVAAVQAELCRARWESRETGLVLCLSTPFPAVHAALSQRSASLELHRSAIVASARLRPDILNALPPTINDAELRPTLDELDQPSFDRHHLRFTLDQPRIVKLLMGEELYGDPKLALRELYQNALDACRYRRAREALLKRRGGAAEESWAPRIWMRAQTIDGRSAISCEDNGIGMEERHLRGLFARGGKRFTDAHEFHIDRALWEEENIGFWPNSRFGVGVLSYFMLAEEIEVLTRRNGVDGHPTPEGISARITGSGSLFRISRDARAPRYGGTKVTLFPKDMSLRPDELLRSVLDWLWLPEMEISLTWTNGTQDHLHAGHLTAGCLRSLGELLPVATSTNSLGQPRVFYQARAVIEENYREPGPSLAAMLDGVGIETTDEPLGVIVNVNEDVAAEVSVDRTRLTMTEAVRSWAAAKLDEDSGNALAAMQDKESATLARFALLQPRPLVALDRRLRQSDPLLPPFPLLYPGQSAPLGTNIGLNLYDGVLSTLMKPRVGGGAVVPRRIRQLIASRIVELARAGCSLPEGFALFARWSERHSPRGDIELAAQLLIELDDQYLPTSQRSIRPLTIGHRGSDRVVEPVALLAAGSIILEQISDLADVAAPLIEAGAITCSPDLLKALAALPPSAIELLSYHVDGRLPWRTRVGAAHLITACIRLRENPSEIAERAMQLAALGLVDADLDRLKSLAAPLDPILADIFAGWDLGSASKFGWGFIGHAAAEVEWDPKRLRSMFDPLFELGLMDQEWDEIAGFVEARPESLWQMIRLDRSLRQLDPTSLLREADSVERIYEDHRLASQFGMVSFDLRPELFDALSLSDLKLLLSQDYDSMAPYESKVPFANFCRFASVNQLSSAEVLALGGELRKSDLFALSGEDMASISFNDYQLLTSILTDESKSWIDLKEPDRLPIELDETTLFRLAYIGEQSGQMLRQRIEPLVERGVLRAPIEKLSRHRRWSRATRDLMRQAMGSRSIHPVAVAIVQVQNNHSWEELEKGLKDCKLLGVEIGASFEFVKEALRATPRHAEVRVRRQARGPATQG